MGPADPMGGEPRFRDRGHAGRVLAARLADLIGRSDVTVLGLPRGGVPVAFEVARSLVAPLDVFVARKLGVPGQEELAMGAVAAGGVRVLNQALIDSIGIAPEAVAEAVRREEAELLRRDRAYRGDRPQPAVGGRVVVVVDDGLATGATMLSALTALRSQSPARLVAAVPVGAPETCRALSAEADEVVCLVTPRALRSVGEWYDDFTQTTDDDIRALLARKEGDHAQ